MVNFLRISVKIRILRGQITYRPNLAILARKLQKVGFMSKGTINTAN